MGHKAFPLMLMAVILVSLVFPVSATNLSCQRVLTPEPSSLYCSLTDQGNISVRIVAFDGVGVRDYRYYGYWDHLIEGNQKHHVFTKLTEFVEPRPGSSAGMNVLIGSAFLTVIFYEFGGTIRAVLNGVLAAIKENIWVILALLFFALLSWSMKQ